MKSEEFDLSFDFCFKVLFFTINFSSPFILQVVCDQAYITINPLENGTVACDMNAGILVTEDVGFLIPFDFFQKISKLKITFLSCCLVYTFAIVSFTYM